MSRDREQVLKARARRLAQHDDVSARQPIAQVVSVRAGGQLFGLAIESVEVLLPVRPIAHLPELPAWLPGLVQLRGEMVSVLDVAQWFKVPQAPAPQILALVHHNGRRLALAVDEVVGFRDVYSDELAEGVTAQAGGRPIRSITRDLQILIDMPALFTHPDIALGGA